MSFSTLMLRGPALYPKLVIATGTLAGVLAGVGLFTFYYAHGASYLSTDPRACNNCHIMNREWDSWIKSGHHHVAGCADCHMPHNFVGKWATKIDNGFWHSYYFTFQNFHEPIQITKKGSDIVQGACLSCHGQFVHAVVGTPNSQELRCVHCHSNVGHSKL
jgi:cytochrome c nitrite reductase small subunit